MIFGAGHGRRVDATRGFVLTRLRDFDEKDGLNIGRRINGPRMLGRLRRWLNITRINHRGNVADGSDRRNIVSYRDRGELAGCSVGLQSRLIEVHGVEIVTGLAVRAQKTIETLGIGNVEIAAFDGGGGWPEHAPYDVILVSAGAPRVPPLLVDQLADGGRLVVPVGARDEQTLVVVRRVGDRYDTLEDTRCRYVDLLGRFGVGSEPPVA